MTVLRRKHTRLVLEDASKLILAGVLAEVPDEQCVAGRIVLCVRYCNIAPWLHRHLQEGSSYYARRCRDSFTLQAKSKCLTAPS